MNNKYIYAFLITFFIAVITTVIQIVVLENYLEKIFVTKSIQTLFAIEYGLPFLASFFIVWFAKYKEITGSYRYLFLVVNWCICSLFSPWILLENIAAPFPILVISGFYLYKIIWIFIFSTLFLLPLFCDFNKANLKSILKIILLLLVAIPLQSFLFQVLELLFKWL